LPPGFSGFDVGVFWVIGIHVLLVISAPSWKNSCGHPCSMATVVLLHLARPFYIKSLVYVYLKGWWQGCRRKTDKLQKASAFLHFDNQILPAWKNVKSHIYP
jgi:hypothetical protein